MNNSNHTPGPWSICKVNKGYIKSGDDPATWDGVCQTMGTGEEQEANAKLIAAAPDSLQAHLDCLKSFELLLTLSPTLPKKAITEIENRIQQLESTIKKATE